MRRKVFPEAYDGTGAILPGMLADVANAMVRYGLNPVTGRPG
jgi:hypothetical protein